MSNVNPFEIIIPIVTFAMGAIFTLMMKQYERRRKNLDENIHKICELSENWYNKLLSISLLYRQDKNNPELNKELTEYSYKALYLPEFQKALSCIRENRKCKKLVEESEKFLFHVTNYQIGLTNTSLNCLPYKFGDEPDTSLLRAFPLLPPFEQNSSLVSSVEKYTLRKKRLFPISFRKPKKFDDLKSANDYLMKRIESANNALKEHTSLEAKIARKIDLSNPQILQNIHNNVQSIQIEAGKLLY